jgi:hypothetical protein
MSPKNQMRRKGREMAEAEWFCAFSRSWGICVGKIG